MRRLAVAGAVVMLGFAATGCGAPIDGIGDEDAIDVTDRPAEQELTPEEAAELDSKADSDAGPGITVTSPVPRRGDITIFPGVTTCTQKMKSGARVYFKCPTMSLTAKITDKGRGIDWDSTVLYGKKTVLFVTKKIDIPVLEEWKNRQAKLVEVKNHPIDDCRNVALIDACSFTAYLKIKDKPVSGAQRESVKSYDVEIDMSAYPQRFDDPPENATCPAPAGAKYWCK